MSEPSAPPDASSSTDSSSTGATASIASTASTASTLSNDSSPSSPSSTSSPPETSGSTSRPPAEASLWTARLRQAQATLRTLRWRVSLAMLAAVVVAVSAGTIAHLVEVSSRLERDLGAQAARITASIRTDLEQTATVLDEELQNAADPRQGVARLLSSGRVEARFLGAQSRLTSGRLEVLKVLQPDGTILTSGHWPASFGALDPLVTTYAEAPGRLPQIVDEATPAGSSPALERWTVVRASGREVVVVAGRFLDGPALERLRARTGADVLSLCPKERGLVEQGLNKLRAAAPSRPSASSSTPSSPTSYASAACLSAMSTAYAPTKRASADGLDPREESERLRLDAIDVGDHVLFVGLDRSGIDTVRQGIIGRAILVGILAVVFAVVLGAVLATRMVQPIESLAEAARKLAGGDLSARVDDKASEGEVQELVRAFNTMAADLEQGQRRLLQTERVAAWQEIARGLAHELKNPLTPILSAMDVIRRARQLGRADFDAILAEQAAAVVEEVMRLKELADAFARFARLPEQKREALVPTDLVDHAVALYASGDGVVVERDYARAPATLFADRTQLLTVLTNLVKNAAEAVADNPGERPKTLKVTVFADGAAAEGVDVDVVFAVEDSGPGIAAEVRERLFTPYVTTKGSRGTGLGLALAHRIVVEHGGTIEASTSSLGGARFEVRLPGRPAPV